MNLARIPCRIVLNDVDENALARCMHGLDVVADKIVGVQGNVLTSLRKLAAWGPFDLVLCGGLFDYLSDRQVRFVIENTATRLLKPAGVFFFTNIALGNPFRTLIEHLGDWSLRERSAEDIRCLIGTIVNEGCQIDLRRDATGLTFLAEVHVQPVLMNRETVLA